MNSMFPTVGANKIALCELAVKLASVANTARSQAVLSNLGIDFERIPLLKGEGGPKGRVRGQGILFTPHPALRATLSLQERDG